MAWVEVVSRADSESRGLADFSVVLGVSNKR